MSILLQSTPPTTTTYLPYRSGLIAANGSVLSTVGAWTKNFSSSYTFGTLFLSSSPANQNDEVVYHPVICAAGTWTLDLHHIQANNRGIYTISTSPDGTTWTDKGTIDGYSASAPNVCTSLTGIVLPGGPVYVRFKMATKNASSSGYLGSIYGWELIRTGA